MNAVSWHCGSVAASIIRRSDGATVREHGIHKVLSDRRITLRSGIAAVCGNFPISA